MNTSLFLTAVIAFAVFTSSIFWISKKRKSKIKFLSSVLGIALANLVAATATIFISFSKTNSSNEVIILITSIIVAIQTISLISIISEIQHNKKIKYSILFLIIAIIPIVLNSNYVHILIPTSLLITIMIFLTYTEDHKSHISLLLTYSSLSIIFYIISFINQNLIQLFIVISSSMFLIFHVEFLKFLKHPHTIKVSTREISPLIPFLKHIVFIIIITNFVFVGTVSTYELGHIASVKLSDCSDVKVVYDLGGFPYTQINCEDISNQNNWILAGLFLPLTIALLLIFVGGKFMKEIALEIIGFDLAISYIDLQILGISQTIASTISVVGIITAAIGLILLTNSRTNHL